MRGRRRTWVIVAVSALVLLAAGAAVAYHIVTSRTADIHRGNVLPFTYTTTAPPVTTTGKHATPDPAWPTYGYDPARSRDASQLTSIRPPYRMLWAIRAHALLEFPPSYAGGDLYLADDGGNVYAIDLRSGKVLWRKHFRASRAQGAMADEPTIWHNELIVDSFDQSVYALDRTTGRLIWQHHTPDLLESSPAVVGGRVFVGGWSGDVFALSATTGHQLWTFRADGAVKDSMAVSGNRVYFGDYAGVFYSLSASTGRLIWKTQTAGLASGYRSGTFYATPSVAYGRVYDANTDGKVYAFEQSTGEIAWTYTFSDWAYGSPAVYDGRIYATAFDGTFAALSAHTGALIWSHVLPYRSLSSPTVIGNLVYVADLGPGPGSRGQLFAYNPASGRLVWRFNDGKYSSVVAAGGDLVVAGYSHLYALAPR
jgi:outer membrane protein assembly factor BamB